MKNSSMSTGCLVYKNVSPIGILYRILTYVIPIMAAVISIVPFIFMALISLQNTFFISGNPARWVPENPTLETYVEVLGTEHFLRWVFNSLFVAGMVTILGLAVQSLAGYAFAKKRFYGREVLFIVVLAGLMVPRAVTIIPLFFIVRDLGLLNQYTGLILPPLALPLGVFLMRQFMAGLPDELMDAARIDGCSEFGIFWRIILPLSTPALATLGIYTFMEQWRDFLWPLIAATQDQMKTLPVGLSVFSTEFRTNYGVQMAGVLLSVLPMIVIFMLLQRYFIKGLTIGALKG